MSSEVYSRRGRFWLPNAPDHQVSGAMRFAPPLAGTLVLDGELLSTPQLEPAVHGVLLEGQRVTALDCYPTGTDSYYGEDGRQQQQTVMAQTFVLDAHLNQDARFDRAGVVLSYLDDWTDMDEGWQLGECDDMSGSIAYHGRVARTATLDHGRRITLKVGSSVEGTARHLVAKQRSSFVVDFGVPVPLVEVADVAGSLQNLLTFAARRPSVILGLEVTSPSALDSRSGAPRSLTVRSSQVDTDPAGPPFLSRWDFLFPAPASDDGFSQLMRRWLALEERLGTALDLFLSLRYAPPKHLESQVMTLCQSAEGYHRRTWDEKVMSAEDKSNLKAALTPACPPAWEQRLRSWLDHVDEPSFKERIERIVGKAGPIGARVTARFSNYPGKLRDYRHMYAHWLAGKPMSEDDVARVSELHDATRILLEACLMQDIGIDMDAAARDFEVKRDFRRLTQRP